MQDGQACTSKTSNAAIRREILTLLTEQSRDHGTALLLITHELSGVSRHADRVVVMNDGRGLETGETASVFAVPGDPYTARLLAAHRREPVTREPVAYEPDAAAPVLELRGVTYGYQPRSGPGRFEGGARPPRRWPPRPRRSHVRCAGGRLVHCSMLRQPPPPRGDSHERRCAGARPR